MFDELLRTVKANITTIRSIIKTNNIVRNIAFGGTEYSEVLS